MQDHFAPHAPTLLLFVSSSLTHIFPEIRIDAIRVLDLLLELVPEEVVSGCMSRETGSTRGGHGMKVLNGYLGLLNVGSRFSEDDSEGAGPSSSIITQASSSTMVLIPAVREFILAHNNGTIVDTLMNSDESYHPEVLFQVSLECNVTSSNDQSISGSVSI